MWDTFWQVVFFVLAVAVLTTCVSCAGGGKKEAPAMDPAKLEQIIKAARKAGCVVKGVRIDAYMETVDIICQGK